MRPSIGGGEQYTPLKLLNSYSTRWRIRARVVELSTITSFINKRTNIEGKILNCVLMDCDGVQINCKFWNKAADLANEKIQKSKVYILSSGRVVISNKRFSNGVDHNYEIVFDSIENCIIENTVDSDDIPNERKHIFSTIRSAEISNKKMPYTTNILGIVHVSQSTREVTSKNGDRLQVKNVTLVDATENAIDVSLWGDFCTMEFEQGKAVGFINFQLREGRNGKVLSSVRNSEIILDLRSKDARDLEIWYKKMSNTVQFNSLSGDIQSNNNQNVVDMTISEIKNLIASGLPEGGLYVKLNAYITDIAYKNVRQNNIITLFYDACKKCNKKVPEDNYCSMCETSETVLKMSSTLRLCDQTGSELIVRAFNDTLQTIFGFSATQVNTLKDNKEKLAFLCERQCLWKLCKVYVRIRKDSYNNELRINSAVGSVTFYSDNTIANDKAVQLLQQLPTVFDQCQNKRHINTKDVEQEKKMKSLL